MERKTFGDYEALFFRQEKLSRLLEKGTDMIMGRNISFREYMEEKGRFSEKRTKEFLDKLLRSLNVWLFYGRSIELPDYETGGTFSDYYKAEKEEFDYYRGLLYCIIVRRYVNAVSSGSENCSFASIVKDAEAVRNFGSYRDMLRHYYLDPDIYLTVGASDKAYYYLGPPKDIYRELFDFYTVSKDLVSKKRRNAHGNDNAAGGEDIDDGPRFLATDKEWALMLASVSDEEKAFRAEEIRKEDEWIMGAVYDSYDEEDSGNAEPQTHEKDDDPPGNEPAVKPLSEAAARRRDVLKVIDLDEYKRHLRLCYRSQYCIYDLKSHVDAVRGMTDVFLADNNRSCVSDAEAFYSVFVRLENALGHIKEKGE